jgi:hypothetical protein
LRQNAQDRSNVAIQNAGNEEDGGVVLRLSLISGDPAAPGTQTLPDEILSPGTFKQFSGILHSQGFSTDQGYVRIERVSGKAPCYAYGVINDQPTPMARSFLRSQKSTGQGEWDWSCLWLSKQSVQQ